MTEPTTPSNGRRVSAYVDFLFKWRWLVLVGTLGIAALAASGGRFIEFKNDYQYFFREDNPQLRAFEDLQEIYTKNDNTLIVVAPESGRVFEPDTLATIGEITERAWQLPFATRVDSITNFQYSHAEEDDLIVDDLVDLERDYEPNELDELRAIALAEPLLKRRLVSDEAHVSAVYVRHTLPRKRSDEATEAAVAVRELTADIENKYPGHVLHLTGSVMLSNSFFEASVQDLSRLVPLMYVVLLVTAVLFLRSFWGMLITLVIIVLSASSAMGIAGWLGIPITPPSSSAPTVIMTLAVADSIHLLVTLFQSMHRGLSKKEAMTESLRINLGPVFLTSLTTAIGLLALNLSDVRPFNDLGNISTIGVTAAFIYTLVVLPPLVAIFPIRAGKKSVSERSNAVVSLGEFVIYRRKGLLWFGAIAIVFLSAMVARNELNDEFVKYFDESFAFRTDTDFASENLSGIYTMEFSLDSGEEGGISNPSFLEDVDAFAVWLREQPDVHHVFTLTDTFKRLNKNMHADDPEWYALPKERELAAQYLLLYEMSLPYGLDLNDTINVDKSSTRMIVTCDNVTAVRMRELQAQSEAWLRANTPEHMWTVPASTNLMFSHISERNIKSSLLGAFIALALIAVILGIAFRSVKFGAISLLPNLAPAMMAFGIWGMTAGRIDVGNAIVTTMALGIIVDDSVHFLSKYLRARREGGMDTQGAVRYAFSTVGSALIVTSFILVAGFLVLTLSPFGLNAGMGLLTAIVLFVALGADLLFLPPLLMEIDKAPRLPSESQLSSPAEAPAQ
ncbi:MAG: MMPL family transporter [Myxococcales bacterium]|nr:MMPL family transporter [Myxococcales bacterium]MDH3484815.1 MMPL family transporter [Myxococcales bacterium]